MTENEKRILTLLYKEGPLSKQELAERGRMGWATVVKLVNRLLAADIIECTGTAGRPLRRGKNAYVYGLTNRKPLAVGIDVEYRTTTVILTDLCGEILAVGSHPTPQNPDAERFHGFLRSIITDFLGRHVPERAHLVGVGIGVPGIGVPTGSKPPQKASREIAAVLQGELGTKVCLEVNTRAYAVFEKWDNQTFSSDDFMFVSIRTGVGSGIFLQGSLLRGNQGMAGEIGHFKVIPDGPRCRCGDRGCLEALINQQALYRSYRTRVLVADLPTGPAEPEELFAGLADLFERAREGEPRALEVVRETAGYLGYCLAHALMILDVPQVIVSGHFGPAGGALLKPLQEAIRRNALSDIDFTVRYVPFNAGGHTRGAALLILREFFTGIP